KSVITRRMPRTISASMPSRTPIPAATPPIHRFGAREMPIRRMESKKPPSPSEGGGSGAEKFMPPVNRQSSLRGIGGHPDSSLIRAQPQAARLGGTPEFARRSYYHRAGPCHD